MDFSDPSPFSDGTLGEAIMAPTRIYIKSVLPIMRAGRIKASARDAGRDMRLLVLEPVARAGSAVFSVF